FSAATAAAPGPACGVRGVLQPVSASNSSEAARTKRMLPGTRGGVLLDGRSWGTGGSLWGNDSGRRKYSQSAPVETNAEISVKRRRVWAAEWLYEAVPR